MRKRLFALAGLVSSLLAIVPAVPVGANGSPPSALTHYQADVRIDPVAKRVAGSVEIRFLPKDEAHVYLHLYPLAFTEEHQGVLWDELLGKHPKLGTYDSSSITVQGRPVAVKRMGDVIEVPLTETDEMMPGGPHAAAPDGAAQGTGTEASEGTSKKTGREETAGFPEAPADDSAMEPMTLKLDFAMTLPQNDGRMSYDEHAMWLGNWLPILAVKDRAGWHLDPYEPIGDPFYSENADYQVNVTLPDGYQLASTASDKAAVVDTGEKERTFHLQADNVRDFALVAMDSSYHFIESKVGNTEVRTWYREGDSVEQAKRNHFAAADSLAYFSRQFGTYPYTEYDVVRTGGSINGMEYPSLVFLDGRHFMPGVDSGVATTVHETAHQWFYSLIGNNQIDEAWLDEGFAEYGTLAFLSATYPKQGNDRVLRRWKQGTTAMAAYTEEKLRPWQSLQAFPDNESYSDLVYSRTCTMLWALREAWGEERLHEMLRRYVSAHRFGIADGAAWRAFLSEAAGEDAGSFLDYWLNLDGGKREEAAEWLKRQRQRQTYPWGKVEIEK